MDTKAQFSYSDVSEHSTKKDLYVVIDDKVYDCTSFADEHPGGEEVLLDVGGKDATDAFEDVGHSEEAREILDKLLIGQVLRQPGDEGPVGHGSTPPDSQPDERSLTVYILVALVAIVGSAAYQYLQVYRFLLT